MKNIVVVLILVTSVLVVVQTHPQNDEDEEDTYDEGNSDIETTTEAESDDEEKQESTTFAVGDVIRAIGALSTSSNGSVDPAVLTSLLTMMLNNNANAATQQASTAATVDPDEEVSSTSRGAYFVGQVNKLLMSGSRGNLSGVVDNAVAIGAPASVQMVMSNVLSTLNRWTGGIFGLTFLETTPTPIAVEQTTIPPPPPPVVPPGGLSALGAASLSFSSRDPLSKTVVPADPNSLQAIIDNILAQQNISLPVSTK